MHIDILFEILHHKRALRRHKNVHFDTLLDRISDAALAPRESSSGIELNWAKITLEMGSRS